MKDVTLTHHGILGQKWGIRRFQNKDGGLTPAGKKRYSGDKANAEYKSTKEAYKNQQASKEELNAAKQNRRQAKRDLSKNYDQLKVAGLIAAGTAAAVMAGKKQYSGDKASQMTDEELVEANKRQGLERTYRKNNPDKMDIAKQGIDQLNNNLNRLKDNSNQRVEHERLNVDHMTDQELRNAIQREQLERQYSDLFGPVKETRTKGQQYVQKALDVAGDVLTVTSTALTVAYMLKQLKLAENNNK